jgi:tetratricopeptide (TPR) repeat protein
VDDYYDLGSHSRRITTSVPDAQTWFDRGLVWSYAFNHEEAAKCFQNAIDADPSCAMGYWGLAYALGPNYNKPWEFFDDADLTTTMARTHSAVDKAAELLGDAHTITEIGLVKALQHRFPNDRSEHSEQTPWAVWNVEYADAMREVYRIEPDDLDVATLFADALMNLTPWELWDLRTGEPTPGSCAVEAKSVLDRALESDHGRVHPGILHMYIHLMEMSGVPEQALVVADRLRGLVPDAGHLHHMPSHLDVLCGDYRRVVSANTDAIVADEKFLHRAGPMNFYTLYRAHNYHFKIYGAMFLGQSAVAVDTASQLEAAIPDELLQVESPPMADWLEGFLAMRVHVYIRFGRWQDIIDLPMPSDDSLYCVSTAMLHYAKGVAYSATSRIESAERESELFAAALTRVAPTRMLFNNTCLDILAVAAAMLEGELEYRKGNYDKAFDALRRSIELDDGLPYDEPWGWMQPTRHAYGALLLEQGNIKEAAAVYRADLGLDATLPRAQQHPSNVWALHGYHECLRILGRDDEATIVGQQLKLAVAMADVPIESSCFCRLTAPPNEESEGHCCSV